MWSIGGLYFVFALSPELASVESQLDRAEQFMDQRDCEQALPLLRNLETSLHRLSRSHNNKSEKAWVYANRSVVAGHLSDCGQNTFLNAQNIKIFAEKALTYDPQSVKAHTILGAYYRAVAHRAWYEKLFLGADEATLDLAHDHLQKALSVNSNDIFALWEMALLQIEKGHKEKALKLLEALVVSPQKDPRKEFMISQAQKKLKEIVE